MEHRSLEFENGHETSFGKSTEGKTVHTLGSNFTNSLPEEEEEEKEEEEADEEEGEEEADDDEKVEDEEKECEECEE